MARLIERSDVQSINVWFHLRGKAGLLAEYLPETGVIVEGIAAGWLYLTNSKAAFIEHIVTNPEASITDVSEAVDLIVEKLSEAAGKAGATRIIAIAGVPSIVKRAKRLGFHVKQEQMTVLSREV